MESRSLRVLVVEDSADTAEALGEAIEMAGHQVELALSGAEALKKAQVLRPEVVFLDIGLPGMSGFEVARHLRESQESAGAYIVALTGYGNAADRDGTAKAGFDRHMVKPISLEALEEALAQSRR